MWQILKAEIRYNLIYLLGVYIAAFGIWALYLFDPSGMLPLFSVTALFLAMAIFTRAIKEKRERLHTLLPVPIKQRSATGLLLFAVLFHIYLISLWPMQLFFKRTELANEYIPFWGLLALNGLTIAIMFIITIRLNLNFYHHRKYQWIANAILVAAVVSYILFKIVSHQNQEIYVFMRDFLFYSPSVAIIVNLFCAGLMHLAVAIYVRRGSYFM
jgi:hypothetical protein